MRTIVNAFNVLTHVLFCVKLSELGSLCGLMPGMTMTSEHLQKVVDLIAGMGTDPRIGNIYSSDAQAHSRQGV